MKIAIIGYSGSGKSTTAKMLAQKLNYPKLHLDQVHYKAGWEERDISEAKMIVWEFLKNNSWIIDGNYSKYFFWERLASADLIIFFDFPRFYCLRQVLIRHFKSKKTPRDDIAEGCDDKIDFEFLRWVLFEGRKSDTRRKYKNIVNMYCNKTVVLKTRSQANRFISSFLSSPNNFRPSNH